MAFCALEGSILGFYFWVLDHRLLRRWDDFFFWFVPSPQRGKLV